MLSKLLRSVVLFLFCALCAAAAAQLLSEAQFTEAYAQAMKTKHADYQVQVKAPLQLSVTLGAEGSATVHLDNAYDEYKHDETQLEAIIERRIAALVESFHSETAALDPRKILPVVKARAYLDQINQALREQGAAAGAEQHAEDYNAELVILYALDGRKSLRYLSAAALREANVDTAGLRQLAIENLTQSLPQLEVRGREGVYMIRAGGIFESSLLLLDNVWRADTMPVKGEKVVAIPTRDVLLVTGSDDAKGLAMLRDIAKTAVQEGPYSLTEQLFVYRNGKFLAFQ